MKLIFKRAACGSAVGLLFLVVAGVISAAAQTAGVQGYLPLVRKAELPPPHPGEEIPNPGFEQGETGWKFTVDLGNPVLSTTFAHVGSNSAELGLDFVTYPLDNQRSASIEQSIYVRSGQTVLQFWEYINSQEEPDPDTGLCPQFFGDHVLIYFGTILAADYSLCMPAGSNPAWSQRSLDLSAYPDQWVPLKIEYTGDSTLPTDYFIDDFAFVAP